MIIKKTHTFGIAKAGAIEKSTGAQAASAKPNTTARGEEQCFFRASSDIRTMAAAPSFNVLAFAAVIVPSFLNTGRNVATFSKFTRVNSSSTETIVGGPDV